MLDYHLNGYNRGGYPRPWHPCIRDLGLGGCRHYCARIGIYKCYPASCPGIPILRLHRCNIGIVRAGNIYEISFWVASWVAVNVFNIGFYVDGLWPAFWGQSWSALCLP